MSLRTADGGGRSPVQPGQPMTLPDGTPGSDSVPASRPGDVLVQP